MPAPYNGVRVNKHRWMLEPALGSASGGVRAPGLVACYLFNERVPGSGKVRNVVADGEQAALSGTVTPATSWVRTAHGYALDFDVASSVYVEVGTPSTQKSIVKNYSILARVYYDDDTQNRAVYSQASGTTAHKSVKSIVIVQTTRKLRLYTSDNTGAEFFVESSSLTVPLTTWTTIGASMDRDASNVIFYVDGATETVATAATITTTPDTAATIRIGYTAGGFFSLFDGRIDWLLVWNVRMPTTVLQMVDRGGPWRLLRPHPRMQFPQDPITAIIQSVDMWRYKPIIMWRKKVKPKPYQLWGSFPVPEAPVFAENLECSVLDLNYGATVEADPYTYDTTVLDLGYGATVETS